jgi:hypothetical protein
MAEFYLRPLTKLPFTPVRAPNQEEVSPLPPEMAHTGHPCHTQA